jgi:hypothetical protein
VTSERAEAVVELVKELDAQAWESLAEIGVALAEARTPIENELLQESHTEVAGLIAALERSLPSAGFSASAVEDRRATLSRIASSRCLPARPERSLRRVSFGLSRLAALGGVPVGAKPPAMAPLAVRVPSALLYRIRELIFPSERLFVGSARPDHATWTIEALWEVTGEANAGHCKADPGKFISAKREMSYSGSWYGFFSHSHPGTTAAHTAPSDEDLRTYLSETADAAPGALLAAIFVGRWVRFFGDAAGHVAIIGDGVTLIDEKEHIYEFTA